MPETCWKFVETSTHGQKLLLDHFLNVPVFIAFFVDLDSTNDLWILRANSFPKEEQAYLGFVNFTQVLWWIDLCKSISDKIFYGAWAGVAGPWLLGLFASPNKPVDHSSLMLG